MSIGGVYAVREDSEGGAYFGYTVDSELLECSECTEDAAYRLRIPTTYRGDVAELRFKALSMIGDEHPRHSDRITVA